MFKTESIYSVQDKIEESDEEIDIILKKVYFLDSSSYPIVKNGIVIANLLRPDDDIFLLITTIDGPKSLGASKCFFTLDDLHKNFRYNLRNCDGS